MRRLAISTLRLAFAALAVSGLATCQHQASPPGIQGPPRPSEAPPLAPRVPTTPPVVAVPETHPSGPVDSVPKMPQAPGCCPDAGMPLGPDAAIPPPQVHAEVEPGAPATLPPAVARAPAEDMNAVRMSIAPPRQPPADAGVDAIVSLPPLPDAGVLRDSAMPMR